MNGLKIGCTLFLLTAAATAAFADPNPNLHWVGAKSDDNYENNWQQSISGHDAICGGFVNQMNSYSDSTRIYWTGLGVVERYHDGTDGSSGGLDTVDISMVCTHGGAFDSPLRFILSLYYKYQVASSIHMKFGNNNRGLSIFTTYSCHTMDGNSSEVQARWLPLFQGGLRIAAGIYDYSHPVTSQTFGTTFANQLHASNKTILSAWLDTADDYLFDIPRITSSGDWRYAHEFNRTDSCFNRIGNMKLSNYKTYPRLTDPTYLAICATEVTDN
ncbi:MAG: hypothetical protein IJM59_04710 [Proteobacteria bacterium]|nr:hypothetical protein [Pseudomonadota bacterium]